MNSAISPRASVMLRVMLATIAFELEALPAQMLSTTWTNRLEFSDLSMPMLRYSGTDRYADVADKPLVYLDMLKGDLRNGSLDRFSLIAPRLVEATPANAEALALLSIHLAATGQPLAARQRCDQAANRSRRLPLVNCAEAMVLRVEGKLTDGVSMCGKAIAADPTHPYPWNILGRIQWQLGDATNALASFRRAIDLNPRFTPAYGNAGAVAFVQGDYPLADQMYRHAIELEPQDAGTRYGLALVLEANGRPSEALAELKRGLQHNPNHILSLRKLADLQLFFGQLDDAIQTGQGLVERQQPVGWIIRADACLQKGEWDAAWQSLTNASPNEVDCHYLKGFCLMAKARYGEALLSMDETLKADPDHFGAYVASAALKFRQGTRIDPSNELTNRWSAEMGRLPSVSRGSIRGASGDWPGSLQELREAEDLVPGFSMAGLDAQAISADVSPDQIKNMVIGVLFNLKNMPDAALTALARATAKNPDNALASYWAGAAHLKKGDRARAVACFDQATRKAPRFFSALYAAGELQFMAGKTTEAAAYYRRAAAIKENAGLSLRLGVFYDNTGEPEKAEREYRNVVRLAPGFFAGYNQLAWHLVARGRNLDEALNLAQKADGLQPGNGSVLDTIGWIYYQKGQYAPALDHLKRAAAINQVDPVILYHLGAAHFALKNLPEAKEALTKSLSLSDRSEVAAEARRLLTTIP